MLLVLAIATTAAAFIAAVCDGVVPIAVGGIGCCGGRIIRITAVLLVVVVEVRPSW